MLVLKSNTVAEHGDVGVVSELMSFFKQFFLKNLRFFYINIYFLDFDAVRNVITRGHAERRPPL